MKFDKLRLQLPLPLSHSNVGESNNMPLAPRKIGDALVPPIGFGAMGISTWYGPIESDELRFKVSKSNKLSLVAFAQ